MKAKIFNIARCSLHDGEGIRTVVYFKGCTLHCQWCHNPEGISPESEILFQKSRCIKCGRCIKICPDHHVLLGEDVIYKRANCSLCMKCVDACPNEALVECGKDMEVDEVFTQIIKDKHYYESSGGGVTFSGGEVLMYSDFLLELLKKCKAAGINTVLESAFNIEWQNIEKVIDYVGSFIIDIKHYNRDIHKKLTGSSNDLILNNIRKISLVHPSILIRIPLIPGANDDNENLIHIANLINTFGSGVKAVELLKYNNMSGNKYIALGKDYSPKIQQPQEDSLMQSKCNLIKKYIRSDILMIDKEFSII